MSQTVKSAQEIGLSAYLASFCFDVADYICYRFYIFWWG